MATYCEVKDVGTLGINPQAIRGFTPDEISAEISVSSDLMDTYFTDRFTLPLVTTNQSVKKCCAVLTAAGLILGRGTDPETKDTLDTLVTYWTSWLGKVAAGKVRPVVQDSSPTAPTDGYPGTRLVSSHGRGLTVRGTGRCREPFQGT